MDSWSSWDDGKPKRLIFSGIQDYLEDLAACELPVRLVVDLDPNNGRCRARMVDADNPSEVLLDRLGQRFMEVSGTDLLGILVELDCMAAAKPRG